MSLQIALRASAAALIGASISIAVGSAQPSALFAQEPESQASTADTLTSEPGDAKGQQREGTKLTGQLGYFRTTGDRLSFHFAGSEESYACLENLALDRIAKVIAERHDTPDQLSWQVSGVFTEVRGGSYLLLTHAVLKNKSRRRSSLP